MRALSYTWNIRWCEYTPVPIAIIVPAWYLHSYVISASYKWLILGTEVWLSEYKIPL